MGIQVYFRQNSDTKDEYEICKRFFRTVDNRTSLSRDIETVICRYSALPFNRELENDLHNMGISPINSSYEHSYIADMGWLDDLGSLTFRTWNRLEFVPNGIPLVLKGRTNSRKFEWNTKMFASDKKQALDIMHELWHDPLIGPQGVVFREYVPLVTYEVGINGMPMTNEWRVFFYRNKLIDYGYYWSTLDDQSVVDLKRFESDGLRLAKEAALRISDFTSFFAIDVAEGQDGKWYAVEVNDGQMSGLSTIPEERFYLNLKKVLEEVL